MKRLMVVFRPPISRSDPHYPEMIREYCAVLLRFSQAEIAAAVTATIAHRTERSWPLPAELVDTIAAVDTKPADSGGEWVGVPARWKWDSRLPELRRLCAPGSPDPLPIIAGMLAKRGKADPWRTMRCAMCVSAMTWEKFGDELYPTGSVEGIRNARSLVEKRAADAGILVDLARIPLDQPQLAAPAARPEDGRQFF